MNEESFTKRQRQLRNFIVMALADGSLGEREVNLIADRCEQLGLHESDLQRAIEYGLHDNAAVEIPADREERESLMKDLIRMMAADGHLAESEKRLFALAAVRMNIMPADLERLITETLPAADD
jgi:uncharacterized tellurite resistance protein B-like protein